MSNVSATDFVGEGCAGAFGAGGPLLLNDDDYPVTCSNVLVLFLTPKCVRIRFNGFGVGRISRGMEGRLN